MKTKFKLNPEDYCEFTELGLEFKIQNNSERIRGVKIEILNKKIKTKNKTIS